MRSVLKSSKGAIDMGVGMFLAAALYHFISALVMTVIMPLLDRMFPELGRSMMSAKQHPMMTMIAWGDLVQATIVLTICIIVAVWILRWSAELEPHQHGSH